MARKKETKAESKANNGLFKVKLNVPMVALAGHNVYTEDGYAVVTADDLETLKKMGVVNE